MSEVEEDITMNLTANMLSLWKTSGVGAQEGGNYTIGGVQAIFILHTTPILLKVSNIFRTSIEFIIAYQRVVLVKHLCLNENFTFTKRSQNPMVSKSHSPKRYGPSGKRSHGPKVKRSHGPKTLVP